MQPYHCRHHLCHRIIARDLFFAATLTALRKKDGGIRAIAVGNVFRRLASKMATRRVVQTLGGELAPVQLGVGVQGGCEAAVHALREYIDDDRSQGHVVVKLDMKNAFNSVRRDRVLEVCYSRAKSLYHLVNMAYGKPTNLLFGDDIIASSTGVQQGDPLGPLLFALAVDDIARGVVSPLNMWYLDDATIGGPPGTVLADLRRLIPLLEGIGLVVNPKKSEIINAGCTEDELHAFRLSAVDVLDGVQHTEVDNLYILGAPVRPSATASSLKVKRGNLESLISRLRLIDAHPALFLLRNCLAMPKLLFTLRCSPCQEHPEELSQFDEVLRKAVEEICNVRFDDQGWRQATLPIAMGGIGIAAAADTALPAYMSSAHATRELVDEILSRTTESPSRRLTCCDAEQSAASLVHPPVVKTQRSWSNLVYDKHQANLRRELDVQRMASF